MTASCFLVFAGIAPLIGGAYVVSKVSDKILGTTFISRFAAVIDEDVFGVELD